METRNFSGRAVYKYVFDRFINDKGSFNTFLTSQKEEYMFARHACRNFLLRANNFKYTYKRVGEIEGELKKSKPVDHTTIMNSYNKHFLNLDENICRYEEIYSYLVNKFKLKIQTIINYIVDNRESISDDKLKFLLTFIAE